jgi:hypothetical protein
MKLAFSFLLMLGAIAAGWVDWSREMFGIASDAAPPSATRRQIERVAARD